MRVKIIYPSEKHREITVSWSPLQKVALRITLINHTHILMNSNNSDGVMRYIDQVSSIARESLLVFLWYPE